MSKRIITPLNSLWHDWTYIDPYTLHRFEWCGLAICGWKNGRRWQVPKKETSCKAESGLSLLFNVQGLFTIYNEKEVEKSNLVRRLGVYFKTQANEWSSWVWFWIGTFSPIVRINKTLVYLNKPHFLRLHRYAYIYNIYITFIS